MFRRRTRTPSETAVPPRWRSRVDHARALVRTSGAAWIDDRLDQFERGLLAAEQDRDRLLQAIAQLDPDRSSRELKQALRSSQQRPGSVPADRLTMLRRRHDTVNRLVNRCEDLAQRIDTAVIDLELLAATVVESGGASSLEDDLDRLRLDLLALEQAHDELREL